MSNTVLPATPVQGSSSTTGGQVSNQTMIGGGASQSTSNTQQQQQGQSSTSNTYLPWQQALQAQAGQTASNYLKTGNMGGDWTMPQILSQAYMQNFNSSVAPQLAAQYGAGSPAIAAAMAQGLLNLEAQSYQNQQQNFQNALGKAAGLGFQSVGATGSQQQTGDTKNQTQGRYMDWQNLTNMVGYGQTTTGSSSPLYMPTSGNSMSPMPLPSGTNLSGNLMIPGG